MPAALSGHVFKTHAHAKPWGMAPIHVPLRRHPGIARMILMIR